MTYGQKLAVDDFEAYQKGEMTKNQKKQLKTLLQDINERITRIYTKAAEKDNKEKPKIPTTLSFKITLVIDNR